jgi:hypothetical protein
MKNFSKIMSVILIVAIGFTGFVYATPVQETIFEDDIVSHNSDFFAIYELREVSEH